MLQQLSSEDKKLVGAYFSNYAKNIILTLESVLYELGAEVNSIPENSDLLTFTHKGMTVNMDLQELLLKIFCFEHTGRLFADQSLITEEKVLHKSLSVIETVLKGL